MKDYAKNYRVEHDDLNHWHEIALKALDFRGKRVLDVGAGTGQFLLAAREAGAAEVFAIEPNGQHASYFQSRNIPYEIGYLTPDTAFKPDIITCFEVIEHIYDPNPIVAAAHALLQSVGGTLVLSTPNAFNAMRALKFVLHQRHHDPLMDPVLLGEGAEHVRGFSFRMVADLMKKHGFKSVRPLNPVLLHRFLAHGIVTAAQA